MIKTFLAAASAAALLSGAATAQDMQGYVQVHGGAVFVAQDGIEVDLSAFALPTGMDVDSSIDYSTGFAVGGLYGYRVSPNFAFEGEFTYRANDIDGVEVTVGETETSSVSIDGELDTLAFMVNGVYSMPTDGSFTPYLGAGIGYATADEDDSDLDGAFAYQVKGGVDFPMGTNSLGVELSYLGTSDFEAEDGSAAFEYGVVNAMVTYKFGL